MGYFISGSFYHFIFRIVGQIVAVCLLDGIPSKVSAVYFKLQLCQLKVFNKGVANLRKEHLVRAAFSAFSLIKIQNALCGLSLTADVKAQYLGAFCEDTIFNQLVYQKLGVKTFAL